MWKRLSLILFAFVSQGYADTAQVLIDFNERLTALEKKVKEEKIYNSAGRPEVVRGYNLYLTAEGLYLEAEENGLEFTIKTSDATFTQPNEYITYKNLDFDYDVGFRVGAGLNISHDSWDLYGVWTHYNTEVHGHSHANPGEGLLPIWSSFEPILQGPFIVSDAKAKFRLNLNVIDGELGREYDIGKWLTIRPSMAIRTAFIDQHYHVLYTPITLLSLTGRDNIKLKNEYWGVGPKAGIATQWSIVSGLSLYGSGAISLLFGEFSLRKNEAFEGLPLPNFKEHHDFHQVRAVIDLKVGIGLDCLIAHDQYHFGVRAGYEQHLYFGQNLLDRVIYNSSNTNLISNLGDLSLQGWGGEIRVDF